MINLNKLPPSNDNLPVHQTQTIPKLSQTPSTSIETKSQQNTPSIQEDTKEDLNIQEWPNSINKNIEDDISWKDNNNSDDDLIDIDMEENHDEQQQEEQVSIIINTRKNKIYWLTQKINRL